MRYVPAPLRDLVIERAQNRCEYCGLAQAGQAATFHIDHIIPITEDGQTTEENLALVVDPISGLEVPVFNPRVQSWQDHFQWSDTTIIGLTAAGRGTIEALNMNRPMILAIRAEEKIFYRHPPD
mgnify:CR=1 FL=1